MCKEEKEYLEKWGRLQDATEELKKEIYGMRCKIKGVIECKKQKKLTELSIESLDKFDLALGAIKIEIEEESFNFFIPEYFLGTEGGVIGINSWNVIAVIKMLKCIAKTILAEETISLPGENSSYHGYGLAKDLLIAISDFEDAFLDYME